MPRGISLHVGINTYSSAFPGAPPLKGCENDAREMEKIAEAKGFEQHECLLGPDATYMRVTTKIRSAAAQLEKDDIFFFSFAGHGFQHVDRPSDGDETDDFLDETMLLYDAELFDDVLRKELWPSFRPGVRVLMIADSCHSGTLHLIPLDNDVDSSTTDEFPVATGSGPVRTISVETGERHQDEYGEFYRSTLIPMFSPTINASVLLLAACEDPEKTGDGDPNGVYTAAMLKVLKESDPCKYDDLVDKIREELRSNGHKQNPTINKAGQDNPDFFENQKPFTV